MAAPFAAISSELIDQFQQVTGSNIEEACSLLEACNGNMEMAIGMHLDNGDAVSDTNSTGGATASSQPQSISSDIIDDDDVRAPIPQTQEVLVETPENFIGFRGSRKRRGQTSVFDGFRDFQREARLQQERLLGPAENGPTTSSSSADVKRGRLEDLFRPPVDIMYTGTFDGAKEHGVSEHKWLIVNIQNVQEFCCQMLNRDVWSNDAVKSIIKEHFVLWQVYHDSEEGQRFTQFYNVADWPYIAILDPRTAENMVVWNTMDAMAFCDMASDFLTNHPTMDGATPTQPAPKRRRLSDCIVDADEDSQLAVAIKQSLHDLEVAKQTELSDDNSDCELETFSDSDVEYDGKRKRQHGNTTATINVDDDSRSSSHSTTTTTEADNNSNRLQWLKALDDSSRSRESASSSVSCDRKALQSSRAIAKVNADGVNRSERVDVEEDGPSSECWQRLLGPDSDAVTRLVLRLPDGGRLELKWPCSTTVEALHHYANFMGYPLQRYELLTNYPRRFLNESSAKHSLKEAGLHPQETVFIQEKDS